VSLRLAESEYSWDLYEMQWEGTMTDKPSTPIEAQAKAAGPRYQLAKNYEARKLSIVELHSDGYLRNYAEAKDEEAAERIVVALNAADRALPASGEAAAPPVEQQCPHGYVWGDCAECVAPRLWTTGKDLGYPNCVYSPDGELLCECQTVAQAEAVAAALSAAPRAEMDADAIVERCAEVITDCKQECTVSRHQCQREMAHRIRALKGTLKLPGRGELHRVEAERDALAAENRKLAGLLLRAQRYVDSKRHAVLRQECDDALAAWREATKERE